MFFILKSIWINDGSADKCLLMPVWSAPGAGASCWGVLQRQWGDPRADGHVCLLPGLPLPPPSRTQEGMKGEMLWAHLYRRNE